MNRSILEYPAMHEQAEISGIIPVDTFRATVDDIDFLASIGIDLKPEEVDEFNRLLEKGETDCRTIHDPTEVYAARERITSMSGMLESIQDDFPSIVEPAKYLATLRYLKNIDIHIDLTRVVNSLPGLLSLTPESVAKKIENLQQLIPGINLAKVVNAHSSILDYNPESVAKKIENLQQLIPGIDLAKVVNARPAVLSINPESVAKKIENLQQLVPGIELAKVVNSLPELLNLNSESVTTKIENLIQLIPGIDLAKVVNSRPSVLSYSPESVAKKIENLQQLVSDIDLANAINTMPAVLGYNPESILIKACILKSLNQWDRVVTDLCSDKPKYGFFTLPVETFILRACDIDLSANLYGSNGVIKKRGIITSIDRKQATDKVLGLVDSTSAHPDIVQKLGLAAMFYAAKQLNQPLRLFG